MTIWLSLPQAAERLGVNRSTAWRWIQSAYLKPAGHVNGKPIFDPHYIEEFVAKRQANEINRKRSKQLVNNGSSED